MSLCWTSTTLSSFEGKRSLLLLLHLIVRPVHLVTDLFGWFVVKTASLAFSTAHNRTAVLYALFRKGLLLQTQL